MLDALSMGQQALAQLYWPSASAPGPSQGRPHTSHPNHPPGSWAVAARGPEKLLALVWPGPCSGQWAQLCP